MSTKSTVVVRGDGVNVELIASGTIRPGMLLERTSVTDTAIAHPEAAPSEQVQSLVALEDALQGKGIKDDNGVLETFADGDRMQCRIWAKGDRFNGIANDGEIILNGDKVQSAGNGKLQKTDLSSNGEEIGSSIGVALENIDMSDSSGADPDDMFTVEVL